MKNRIHQAWEAIASEQLRRRVREREEAKADACCEMLREGSTVVSLRVLGFPHPEDSGVILGHLVLFVGDMPAVTLASDRTSRN